MEIIYYKEEAVTPRSRRPDSAPSRDRTKAIKRAQEKAIKARLLRSMNEVRFRRARSMRCPCFYVRVLYRGTVFRLVRLVAPPAPDSKHVRPPPSDFVVNRKYV